MVTGQVVRFPAINITGARTLSTNDMKPIELFKTNYGHAGPDFVKFLFHKGYVDAIAPSGHAAQPALQRMLDEAIDKLSRSRPDSSTVARAAVHFAVLQVAGTIAKDAGLLPVSLDVDGAIQWAWESYLSGSEAEALLPMDRAMNAMRTNIHVGWNIDIAPLTAIDPNDVDADNFLTSTEHLERPQYRPAKWGWYDDQTLYILRGKLAELAGGTDAPQAIAKALRQRGFLHPRGERLHHVRLPGRGDVEHYRLARGAFLGESAEDSTDD